MSEDELRKHVPKASSFLKVQNFVREELVPAMAPMLGWYKSVKTMSSAKHLEPLEEDRRFTSQHV